MLVMVSSPFTSRLLQPGTGSCTPYTWNFVAMVRRCHGATSPVHFTRSNYLPAASGRTLWSHRKWQRNGFIPMHGCTDWRL